MFKFPLSPNKFKFISLFWLILISNIVAEFDEFGDFDQFSPKCGESNGFANHRQGRFGFLMRLFDPEATWRRARIINGIVANQDSWPWQVRTYRMRLNRPRSVYSLFPFLGPDFELSNCKNAYKNSTNLNETSYTCFSCTNASQNNIKA